MDKNDFSRFAIFSHQGIILDIGDFAYSEVEDMIVLINKNDYSKFNK